jgi:hypothetical protein
MDFSILGGGSSLAGSDLIRLFVLADLLAVMLSSSMMDRVLPFMKIGIGFYLVVFMSLCFVNWAIQWVAAAHRQDAFLLGREWLQTLTALFLVFLTLACTFYLLLATCKVFERYSGLRIDENPRSGCLCVISLIILYLFGEIVRRNGQQMDGSFIDIMLGVGGTWLVARVVMPWTIPEFDKSLYPVFDKSVDVSVKRLTIVKIAATLGVATMVLYSVIRGLSTLQDGSAVVDPLPETGVLNIILFNSLWLILLLAAILFRKSNWLSVFVVSFHVIWLVCSALVFRTYFNLHGLIVIWPLWFAMFGGVFAMYGYRHNSSEIFGYKRRLSTWPAAVCVFANVFMIILTTMLVSASEIGWFCAPVVTSGVAIVAIMHSMAHVETEAPGEGDHDRYSAMRWSVVQDGLSAWLLGMFFGMIPMIMVDRIGLSTSLFSFVIFYGGFIALGASFFVQADREHLKRSLTPAEGEESRHPLSTHGALTALERHIERHLLLTAIVIFPITFVQFMEAQIDQIVNGKEFSASMWGAYLDVRGDRVERENGAGGVDRD